MNYLLNLFRGKNTKESEKLIPYPDSKLIARIKNKYRHLPRETFYKGISYNMDGLYCHAVPGTIETIITILSKRIKTSSKTLLNLGGGTGQVPKLLAEIGFKVINVDIEPSSSKSHLQFDLNSTNEIPLKKKFDVVLCQEIIEHIENPWLLVRRSKRALKKNGMLIISTPNIMSGMSKKILCETNYFHWFDENSFSYHINPLPYWEIILILKKSGFKILNIAGSGEYYFRQASTLKGIIEYNEGLIISAKLIE